MPRARAYRFGRGRPRHAARHAEEAQEFLGVHLGWFEWDGDDSQYQTTNYQHIQSIRCITHREGLVDLRQVVRAVVGTREVRVQLEVHLFGLKLAN